MIKSDGWIRRMAAKGMIEPFHPEKIRAGISLGLSSYGYDFTLSEEFKVFRGGGPVSPKRIRDSDFEDVLARECVIPAGSFVLGRTVEYFRIPREVLGICFGKSTYARCGIVIHVTPLEPEWEGNVTIQIANLTPVEALVHAGEGIGQVLFLGTDQVCEKSYRDLAGKYQSSSGIVLPK